MVLYYYYSDVAELYLVFFKVLTTGPVPCSRGNIRLILGVYFTNPE